ncbi:hypothetical protein COLO4_13995 [Corchorus olitorius]|uniref:Bulb-type lectin domain-containing protein n=1 Tax=Corchorus olitorius TaxID=93759 RepID=A0A1R3JTX8_9ROSI|nr:hypothetical protein COLO4_13995 [Corchorus olitorius]
MAKHFFFLLSITFLFAIANADQSPQSNITKGTIIYTNSAKNFWPSHSGHFAFGFYNSGANVFRVGIWLVGSPKNTILWTAARNDPGVPAGASLAFAEDGRVLVRGPAGEILLVIVEPTQMPSVASMLDSGKFVLYTSNSEIVWSSFDYPTNTLLVGQTLERGKSLYSSLSETNDSIGNFRLLMLGDGNLIAIPVRIFPDYASDGRLYLQNSTGGTVQNIFNGGYSVEDTVFYRATFDIDGVLRLYRHRIGAAAIVPSMVQTQFAFALQASSPLIPSKRIKGVC